MPNEFEKQVKQKMEELSFVPQEPVWENIEKQIRKKKDRKRMILWLPVLLLLVGGTAVWLNHQSEAGHRLETNADHKLNEYKAEVHGQSDEPLSDSHHTNTAEGSIAGKDKQAGEQQNSQTTANSSAQIDDKNESKRIELSEVKAIASKKHSFNNIQLNSSSSVSRVSSKQKQSIIAQETENTNYYLPVVNDPILHTYDVQKNTWPDKINTRPLITANLLQNESSNKVADKHVHSWKVGVMVDAGKSSLRNKLDLSSNALRDNYAASPASYSNYVPPSDIKN
ncbi:MAG TPA: hypothetical protein VNS32_13565, partial [Flavisolibacter sp.]|nr:hypothetical protein [Flavisolibacter sp.]